LGHEADGEGLGTKARVVIDADTGEAIESGHVPRQADP
jgi:hypothetical protein